TALEKHDRCGRDTGALEDLPRDLVMPWRMHAERVDATVRGLVTPAGDPNLAHEATPVELGGIECRGARARHRHDGDVGPPAHAVLGDQRCAETPERRAAVP